MTLGSFLGLLGVAVVLALIPGPDTFLSLRYALRERRLAFWSAAGTTTALFIWAALAALGLVSLLRASALAYELLTAVGGGYLVYLGVRALRGALASRSKGAPVEASVAPPRRIESRGPFFAGIGTSLTNPKTGLFFVSLFPQFMPREAGPVFVVLVLGGTVAGVVYLYLIALAFTADAAGRWLSGPRTALGIELASGAIFMSLGLFVLAEAGVTAAGRLPA